MYFKFNNTGAGFKSDKKRTSRTGAAKHWDTFLHFSSFHTLLMVSFKGLKESLVLKPPKDFVRVNFTTKMLSAIPNINCRTVFD